jgi:deoxyadenosine/deoxycytidine kinase
MRIEICGAIGSGKSTLSNLLINYGFNLIPENFNTNPFWESFYLNPGHYIFETEITFLLQHYHDLKKNKKKNKVNVCDFSFTQDLAYAMIGLSGKKLNIFKDTYEEIVAELGLADSIICLKCEVDVLLERIKRRAREEEKLINAEFLTKLTNSIYTESEKVKKETKVIYIDSYKYDYVNDVQIQKQILDQITKTIES